MQVLYLRRKPSQSPPATASHIPECSEGAGKPWRVHRPRQRAPTRGLAARRRRPKPARPDERSTRARSDAPPPPPQPRRRSAPIAAIVESGAVPIRPEEPGARDGRWTSACGSSGRRLMRLDNEVCEACESACGSFHRSKAGGRWADGRRRRARTKARKEGRKMVVGWDEVLWGKERAVRLARRSQARVMGVYQHNEPSLPIVVYLRRNFLVQTLARPPVYCLACASGVHSSPFLHFEP